MGISLTRLLEDVRATCTQLQDTLFGVCVDRARLHRTGSAVLDITFQPPPEFAAEGYVVERGRICAHPNGQVNSFPLGSRARTWHHRNPSPFGLGYGKLCGDLCLWYPRDPRGLRWEWEDGFEEYVTRVHRHLFFEEYYRREGAWPVEDAPHGDPATGAHPVLSSHMKKAAKQWAS